jgi:hypothetical protein
MTLIELVERQRGRIRRFELTAGVALMVGLTCGLLAVGVLLLGRSRWLALPRGTPFVIWTLLIAGVAGLAWRTRRLVALRASRGQVGAAIEREQTLRAGALRGAIEVAESGAFGREAAAVVAGALRPRAGSLVPVLERDMRAHAVRLLAAAAGAAILLGIVAPIRSDGLMAILRPVRAWRGTLLGQLAFDRLPPVVMRGDTLRVTISAPGRSGVQLYERTTGEGWSVRALSVARDSGTAVITLGPLAGDLSLVATDGRAWSDTAVVRVTDRPFVGAITMRAVYPAYLQRPAETLPVGEPAAVPRGTIIELAGRASTPLAAVGLVRERDSVALRPDSRAFTGRFAPAVSGVWQWYARGVNAAVTDLPAAFEVTVVPDSAPRVELLAPAADTVVAAADRVMLQVAASDDHGLALIELQTWRTGPKGSQPIATQRIAADQGPTWSANSILDLAARGLQPGDALHVRVIATDNSPWAQRGESRELLLKVPSVEERREIARALGDSAVKDVRAAAEAQRQLQQRTDEAARDRGERPKAQDSGSPPPPNADQKGGAPNSMSFESAERAKALAKDERDLTDRVSKLQETAAALEQQLKQAGALDSALSRQLHEAQQLLHDALTPELLAQMKKLENAAQNLSADDARSALRDLADMQKRMREQLEKSAQMLQRAAAEGAMQTLHDEAKDIAERERAMADSAQSAAGGDSTRSGAAAQRSRTDSAGASRSGARDSTARGDSAAARNAGTRDQSRELADRSDRLAEAMKQLEERLATDNATAGAQRTDSARAHAQQSKQAMQQQKSDAGKAADQMNRAAQDMQEARDAQVSEWKQELTSELDKAIQELLQMSRQESSLEQQARKGQAQDQMRGQQSAVQQGVDQTQNRLQQEGQKTSLLSGRAERAMSDAAQKVSQATQSASDPRSGGQTPGAMGEAADALNRAAAALARDRERANSATSASGFSEMIQQMVDAARKQSSINAQAQGLMPMPGSGAMSPDAQATARMLSRQERGLAQQLDDLSDAAGGDRAAQLAKEARAVADALEGGRVDAATVARQEQLLKHMLDAGRSLEKDEREDTGKREAQAATDPRLHAPDNKDAGGKSAVKFREPTWDELRGLSADERRAILEYFKRINGQRP